MACRIFQRYISWIVNLKDKIKIYRLSKDIGKNEFVNKAISLQYTLLCSESIYIDFIFLSEKLAGQMSTFQSPVSNCIIFLLIDT